MSYSITIHTWKKNEREFGQLYYVNERIDNHGYDDVLQSYDSYSGFHTVFEVSSPYSKQNIYELARFLINSTFLFQYAEGDTTEDKFVAALLTEYVEEIIKEKEEKKLEYLFLEIKSLPKKYCIYNSLSFDYIDEWIEIIFASQMVENFYPNWLNLKEYNTEKLEIETYLHCSEYNKINIKHKKAPVFYYNYEGLIFMSFNNNWIDRMDFKYCSSENLSKTSQLENFKYTFFLYEEEVIISLILNLLKRKNDSFNQLIKDIDLGTKLILSSELVLKLFITPKSFSKGGNN
ncbi:hypothetical protein NLG42_10510 [Flavobacterium plurextorum]|uniref:hypothetical protein n=1 Tax=Flavobacterium TaxID=237 RepID=UPI00214DDFFD|nr:MULTISPECIES: hypothetical protein [Flavobacterium]UUW11219.1 hypothetical protein NLG42_10510 [Flavobacterium plurextorum]